MASLKLEGFQELDIGLVRISSIPWPVKEKALNEMAEVAAEEIRSTGENMGVRDPDSDVHILDKIKPTKAKETETGGYQNITFSGTRTRGNTRTRNAEIAFVNEYGKSGQKARPFIRVAMSQNADKINDPGAEVILDWVENEWVK